MTIHTAPAVIDWIAHHAVASPAKTATIDLASGRRQTYKEMHLRVGRLAAHLQSLGIKPGDRVGFIALNSADILDIIFATWRIGGISLALNFRLTAKELDFIVNDAGADVLIYDHEFEAVITELKPLIKTKHFIGMDGMGGRSDMEAAIASVATSAAITARISQTMDDQCMLMYSSGTTGRPKGVIITHGMVFYSAVNGVSPIRTTADAVWLSIMPLFHVGGLNISSLPALWFGATTVVMRSFEPGATLDVIDNPELGITHTIGVPAMYNAMRLHPKVETTDFSRITTALAGGASVPKELIEWWCAKGLKVQDGYGMTESVASNCVCPKEDVPRKIGTSGKALMFTEMRIVAANGKEAAPGEPGEIWMRGPTITPGYWNNPEANKSAFKDGWFLSGDIARRDSEGYITIEDRAKDMYISGGENVYPAEVEACLSELDTIIEVAVIGIADERWGETGCAVVVLKDGHSQTLAQIQGHCAKTLAKFKHPSHLVLMEALPRNATGKVKKFELRQTVPEKLTENA